MARLVTAARGRQLRCRAWRQEALLRLLENVLGVGENPAELVAYAVLKKATCDWPSHRNITRDLLNLRDEETLLLRSGKPIGIFWSHTAASLVSLANSNLVGRPGPTTSTSTKVPARPGYTSSIRPSARPSTTRRRTSAGSHRNRRGQWDRALAMAYAFFDLECTVYMVKVSYHQKPYRRVLVETWGAPAPVRAPIPGSAPSPRAQNAVKLEETRRSGTRSRVLRGRGATSGAVSWRQARMAAPRLNQPVARPE